MRHFKVAVSILALAFVMLGFQNCAEDLNLDQLEQSSGPNGSNGLPPSPPAEVLITSQSPATINQNEGTNLQLFVVVSNAQNLNVVWAKDGQVLQSGPSTSYNIANLNLSHAGTYQATVTHSGGPDIQSQPISVTVTALQQTFTNPVIANNGVNYRIYTFATASADSRITTARAFCRAQWGPAADYVSFTLAATQNVSPIAFVTDQFTCMASVIPVGGYVSGFCLYNFTVQAIPFQTVVCRR